MESQSSRSSLPEPPAATADVFRAVLDRHRRRRQWFAGTGAVLALVAGFVGGWSVPRPTDDSKRAATTGDDVDASADEAQAREPTEGFGGTDDGFGQEFERVALRTTAGGIIVRLYRSPQPQAPCEPDLPCTPPACRGDGYQVEVSNEGAVATGWAQRPGAPPPGEVRVLFVTVFGVAEGDPGTMALVDGGPGVDTVVMEVGDARDETPLVDGVAALAVPASSERPRIVGLDGAGGPPAEASIIPPPDCRPVPPALPPDSGAPPSDRAAAEREIREVVRRVFRTKGASEQRDMLAWIEDGDELAGVQAEVQRRYGDGESEVSADVLDDITFQGPTNATFRFRIVYNGTTVIDGALARAVLQDGRWKVSRATWCRTVEMGGVRCPED